MVIPLHSPFTKHNRHFLATDGENSVSAPKMLKGSFVIKLLILPIMR